MDEQLYEFLEDLYNKFSDLLVSIELLTTTKNSKKFTPVAKDIEDIMETVTDVQDYLLGYASNEEEDITNEINRDC